MRARISTTGMADLLAVAHLWVDPVVAQVEGRRDLLQEAKVDSTFLLETLNRGRKAFYSPCTNNVEY